MNDHQGVVAALAIALALVVYYAHRQRAGRLQAEAERDVYDDELTKTHEGDTQLARLRERRLRAVHAEDTLVELADAVGVYVPAQRPGGA